MERAIPVRPEARRPDSEREKKALAWFQTINEKTSHSSRFGVLLQTLRKTPRGMQYAEEFDRQVTDLYIALGSLYRGAIGMGEAEWNDMIENGF
jgi:hypothetical protein